MASARCFGHGHGHVGNAGVSGRTRGTEECPNCGAIFRRGRLACPECGSDAQTGWQDAEEIDYQSIELPDCDPPAAAPPARRRWLALIAALVAAALLLPYLLRLLR
jgi:hypothetical protein